MRSSALNSTDTFDGFWLPQETRRRVLTDSTEWVTVSFCEGRPCAGDPRAEGRMVAARWPDLSGGEWGVLLAALAQNREQAPRGRELRERLRAAVNQAAGPRMDPCSQAQAYSRAGALVDALSTYTGYSKSMIGLSLAAPISAVEGLESTLAGGLDLAAASRWTAMPGMPGRLRFFPAGKIDRVRFRLPGARGGALFRDVVPPALLLGCAAGNVPGGALLIVLLALGSTVDNGRPPVVVVRNSRREPIFSPAVLSAIEAVDPQVLSTVALLVWDYERPEPQRSLVGQADLVVVAAGDDAIDAIHRQVRASPRRPRFHAHGHKVSFTIVSAETLDAVPDFTGPVGRDEGLRRLTLLTALDSVLWDQNGCLSSRVHFVEGGVSDGGLGYAEALAASMRRLAEAIPRGAWPRQWLNDRFDRLKALEGEGVRVLSGYEDDFVVALDLRALAGRPADARMFASLVNDCQGRIIVVRLVPELMRVPADHLAAIPRHMLQSLTAACGRPGEHVSPEFLRLADACAQRGVTAIRAAGKAAFPRLAYSWDGLLPIDIVRDRCPGYFTTIEFDKPFEEAERSSRELAPLLARCANSADSPSGHPLHSPNV